MKKLDAILVGAGGFGGTYVRMFMDGNVDDLNLVAIIDPYVKKADTYDSYKDTIPTYDTLEEFFGAGNTADLTIISSPIHLHYPQSITALENGSHVLCEKPLVPTLDELNKLYEKTQSTGKTLSVAFQWCYSSVMRGLKERILAGEFGKPICFKTLVCWPRGLDYYSRSAWAGKIKSADGHIVYDSVVSNATAHYMQNMLFLLGPTMEESATVGNIEAENYRANDIESFDTCLVRGEAGGAGLYYAGSHAVNFQINPIMHYELENATILVNAFDQDGQCRIHHKNGVVEELGTAVADGETKKLALTAQAIMDESPLSCTTTTVRPFTELIEYLFNKVPVQNFSDDVIIKNTERTYVKNLHMDLVECFNQTKLLSER